MPIYEFECEGCGERFEELPGFGGGAVPARRAGRGGRGG